MPRQRRRASALDSVRCKQSSQAPRQRRALSPCAPVSVRTWALGPAKCAKDLAANHDHEDPEGSANSAPNRPSTCRPSTAHPANAAMVMASGRTTERRTALCTPRDRPSRGRQRDRGSHLLSDLHEIADQKRQLDTHADYSDLRHRQEGRCERMLTSAKEFV